jgi:hypothetical protein
MRSIAGLETTMIGTTSAKSVAKTTDARNVAFSLKARIPLLLLVALLEATTIGKIYVRKAPMSINARNVVFCCMPQSRPIHLTALRVGIISGIR